MLVFLAMLDTEEEKTKFEQLYITYRQVMYYTAHSVLHDVQLSEDAVQQAFMRIMNHMQNISDVECPKTKSFVVIIVKNIAINLYNHRRKRASVSLDELETWMPDMTQSPVATVEARESYQFLASLIQQMPESYRSVLLLRYDNGYRTAEIAAMLGLSEENVKKRIQRARKKLEQLREGVATA